MTQQVIHCIEDKYVLLYYKYLPLTEDERENCRAWYYNSCISTELCGRVRVALDGVNCTLGGSEQNLKAHVLQVQTHPLLCGGDIDFKLSLSSGPLSKKSQIESGFDRLNVKAVKEVVSLGTTVEPSLSACHISPQHFHSLLDENAKSDLQPTNNLILLDVRNGYESDIGHFSSKSCELIVPRTRQFSDFPGWIDSNLKKLEGKKILMYCTGGVRCERASAYLRSKGPLFNDVFQLSGGIERYLQAFPDGGFFKGCNFVFDERVSVAPLLVNELTVVGHCALCNIPWDSYSSRQRCSCCRVLMLVCDGCVHNIGDFHLNMAGLNSEYRADTSIIKLLCPLCQ